MQHSNAGWIVDVLTAHNNGTFFVRPTLEGKLAQFATHTAGTEFGWLFADANADPEKAAWTTGSRRDYLVLKDLLEAKGFVVLTDNSFVPMSNGHVGSSAYNLEEIMVLRGQTEYFLFLTAVMQGANK